MNEGDNPPTRVIFLFDVDNTLVDNDRVAADLQRHLASEVGAEGAQEYGGFSSNCGPNWAMQITSVLCKGIGPNIRMPSSCFVCLIF